VVQTNLLAVLPASYAENLALDELVRRPLVTIARARAPSFHDHVMSYLTQKDLRIQSLQTVTDFYTAVALAEAGVAWAIVPSSTPYEPARTRIKPLEDESARWQIGLVHPPGAADDPGGLVATFWSVVAGIREEQGLLES